MLTLGLDFLESCLSDGELTPPWGIIWGEVRGRSGAGVGAG
jgi:hypothetical protein